MNPLKVNNESNAILVNNKNETMLNMNPYNLYGVIKLQVNSHAAQYTPFTAINHSQYSSVRTVPIPLSAVSQETLTTHARPLWGRCSIYSASTEIDVKVWKTEISLYTVLGLSSQDGWDSSCSQRETKTVCTVLEALTSLTETREDECLVYSETVSY